MNKVLEAIRESQEKQASQAALVVVAKRVTRAKEALRVSACLVRKDLGDCQVIMLAS